MKRILLSGIAAVVALVLFFPQLSVSEINEGTIELEPFLGYYFLRHQDDKGGLGVRGGYNFTENWGFELAFDYAGSRANFLHADVLYHFMPEEKLNPFVFGGVGNAHLKPRDHSSHNKILAEIGVGAKYFISDNIAIRADIRDIQEKYNHVAVTAGVVFTFGGPKKTVSVRTAAAEPPPPPPKPEPAPAPPAPKVLEKLTLQVHFETDKAVITQDGLKELEKAVVFVKKYPGSNIRVDGHTDNIGSDEHNQDLSGRRAAAVREFLIREAGIESSKITSVGHGEAEPVADNSTPEGRAMNRRVEIAILSD